MTIEELNEQIRRFQWRQAWLLGVAPVSGGAEDGEDEEEEEDEDDKSKKTKTPPADEKDPDKLKTALDAERKAREAAESNAKKASKELIKAKNTVKKLQSEGATDQEKAVAKAREEAAKEATGKANSKLVAASVKVAAAGKMRNPALAVRLLDLEDFSVDDDGDVDEDAIEKAVDKLLEDNPELASDGKTKTKSSGGDHNKGKKGENEGKADMNDLLRAAVGK